MCKQADSSTAKIIANELTVSNLSPIPIDLPQVLVLEDILPCTTVNSHVFPPLLLQFLEELCPDAVLFIIREILIVYHGMDPTYESVVKLADPISGQEEDSAVVFDDTKEYCEAVSY